MGFDEVTNEKFNQLADEMDAQWKAMQADPRVQQVMAGWAEALNSELPYDDVTGLSEDELWTEIDFAQAAVHDALTQGWLDHLLAEAKRRED